MQVLGNPIQQWPRVAFIGEQMRQTWEGSRQGTEQEPGSTAIHDTGAENLDGQQQALGVNQDMALAPVDFFSCVVATLGATNRSRFDRLAIDDRRMRFRVSASRFWRTCSRRLVMIGSQSAAWVQMRKEWCAVLPLGRS